MIHRNALRRRVATLLAAAAAAAVVPVATALATDRPAARRTAMRAAQPAQPPAFATRAEVREFVGQMVERHGFVQAELMALFGRIRPSDAVLKLIAPAPSGFRRSWMAYRARFVEPVRIREGLRFWREHQPTIRLASERYGVPEEIIVAIIGVETVYGRFTGEHRVVEALATLAFDEPRRGPYFRSELEQFLLLARDQGVDPLEPRGSYAGAIGLPQFMPGSIRRFAVDFDGDGTIDLRSSTADAIGSVARFLAEHGWRAGGATHFPVTVEDEILARSAIEAGVPPTLTTLELAALGVTSPHEIPVVEKVALIDLPNGDDSTHYVLGANNFYVITRYNRSYFYAMAVIDLARTLRESR